MKAVDYIREIMNTSNVDRAWIYMYNTIRKYVEEHGEISKCGIVFCSDLGLRSFNLSKNDIYRIIEKLDNEGFETKYWDWIDGFGASQYNISVKW